MDLLNQLRESLDIAKLVDLSYNIENNEPIIFSGYDHYPIKIEKTHTEVLISKKNDTGVIYINFPGTQGIYDGVTDLLIAQIKFKCGCWFSRILSLTKIKVHMGFLNSYCSIRKKIFNKIEAIGISNTIYVGGHSLGGALATLLVVDLKKKYPEISIHLRTFGNPAVGNPEFVQLAESGLDSNIRMVNKDDPVPYLLSDNSAYKQLNGFIEVDGSGNVSYTPTTDIDSSIGAAMSFINSLIGGETPQEHKMTTYIERIKLL